MTPTGDHALIPNIIDPDALWACTTCGACVEQCPVDIEHVDTIIDMRRYQVLMESEFPVEAGSMMRNIENRGDPWGLGTSQRRAWTEPLDFEIPVVTDTIGEDIEYLYWVGCAGAFDDRARATTQATARLLHEAGVTFAILGPWSRVPVTRPGEWATSSCTRSKPNRTSRRSRAQVCAR